MPKTARRKGKAKPLSEKQRADDDRLRAVLRDADLKAFDRALAKAIDPRSRRGAGH